VPVLRALGRGAEADALAAALSEPIGPLDLFARGSLAAREGRDEDALADFEAAVVRSPRAEALLHIRRANWLMQTGKQDEALAAAVTLELLFPTSALAWFMIGSIRGTFHDSAGARDALQRAVELEPDLAEAWLSLGISHLVLHEPDAGRAALERALALPCPDPWRINALVGVVFQRGGLPEEALAPLQLALEAKPDLLQERRALGEALLALDRFEPAAAELRRVVAAAPDDAGAAKSLARAEEGLRVHP
jgi:tetratricopeptide (TPR) repeat protein